MAEQIQLSKRQRELFIKKSTRVAASYLNHTKALSKMPDAVNPFFDVLENIYVKLEDIHKPEDMKSIGTLCVMVRQNLYMLQKLCQYAYVLEAIQPILLAMIIFHMMHTH